MKIRNRKSGKEYEPTEHEWNVILCSGNAHKYDIISDDMPIELKALRAKLPERDKPKK